MLNGTKNEFRKQDTTAIKGIAIIMLLFYHCFSTADRFAGYDISFLLPQNIEMWLCNACNVCVGMFAVLSAYGITVASKKMLEERDYKRYFVHRYLSLMKGFWIAFAYAVVISAVLGKLSAYGSGLTFVLNFVSELSGLAYILQTSSLCGTWWYISFTIMLVVMIPFIDIIYQKWGGYAHTDPIPGILPYRTGNCKYDKMDRCNYNWLFGGGE